jgi:hypothetical protein
VVYVPQPQQVTLKSLTIPLPNLQQVKFQQPWFKANYIEGICIPVMSALWVFAWRSDYEFALYLILLGATWWTQH